jgi:hypothetical protein
MSGCGSNSHPAPTTTSGVPTVPTTARPHPTTTVYAPSAPQSSAEAAAKLLVQSWAGRNRAQAATVAAPAAVRVLFAAAYPGSALAILRGCSSQFTPIVCTFGPPGGGNPNDSLYELSVSRSAKGWYVVSVSVLR